MITLDEAIAHFEAVGNYVSTLTSQMENNNDWRIAQFLKRLKELEAKIARGELVEVTRCKDCISHYSESTCGLLDVVVGENDFCSYGERREQ